MGGSERTSGSGGRLWRVTTRVVVPVIFAGAMWYLFTNVVRFGTVVSESMNPTLKVGDYYLLRVDAYDADRPPKRGQIVIFKRTDGSNYAKRVIAVEGDRIGIMGGRVFLNGAWLKEPYVKQSNLTREASSVEIVPENTVYVLGDNRNKSEDSRDYGVIDTDDIVGRVTSIVWPRDRARSLTISLGD